ncbi:histidine phosphatase family protein [Emcibacter sp.]|uniref:histidine phosphatase family protein n=1 Tax=Emcibacter sp. TaxID=1979954 RepID=UPI003A92EEF8
MKKILIFSVTGLLLFLAHILPAWSDQTIYLIRHAEKISDGSADPPLSTAGRQRAEWYARYFAGKELSAIYSTDLKRTRETAGPTARATGLEIKYYSPRNLPDFAREISSASGPVLVVGHSNTTPNLAGFLTNREIAELHDGQYDRIFVVSINKEGTARLHVDLSDPHTD